MERKSRIKNNKIFKILIKILCIVLIIFMLFLLEPILDEFLGIEKLDENSLYAFENNDATYIVFFDCGQGDSILIIDNDTKILIDGGPDSFGKQLIERLKHYQVDSLDLLISTHPHSDHVGGLSFVLNKIPVEMIAIPDLEYDSYDYNGMLSLIESLQIPIIMPVAGQTFKLKDLCVNFLSPEANTKYDSTNAYSIACIVEGEYGSIFLGGDAEIVNEEFMLNNDLPNVDIYKANHHGSSSANSKEFVSKISPEYIIISCGKNNDYNHPHDETLEVFKGLDITPWITAEKGEILIIQKENGMQISSDR